MVVVHPGTFPEAYSVVRAPDNKPGQSRCLLGACHRDHGERRKARALKLVTMLGQVTTLYAWLLKGYLFENWSLHL